MHFFNADAVNLHGVLCMQMPSGKLSPGSRGVSANRVMFSAAGSHCTVYVLRHAVQDRKLYDTVSVVIERLCDTRFV